MNYDENRFEFRPKISGQAKREKTPSLRALKVPKTMNTKNWRSAAYVKPSAQFSRRVIVKARVVKMNTYGRKAAALHITYIERNGVEKDGSPGRLYGKEEELDRHALEQNIPEEKNQFRFIVSPEDAHDLNLTQYTKELMQEVEKDLGRHVKWGAVNHYNTDNPHVHIVVRGVDMDGVLLTIDPKYIGEGMRFRAQDIATRDLGSKTEIDIQNQEIAEIGKGKFTSLDRKIAALELNGTVDVGSYPYEKIGRLSQSRIMGRLEKLEQFGLAEKSGSRSWNLQDNWKDKLLKLGERQEIFRSMHDAVGGDSQRYRINATGSEIQGRLVKKGLENELHDKFYFIVEEPSGQVNYISLDKNTNQESFREGDIITIKKEQESWLKKADLSIAEQAKKSGGFYDKEEHFQRLTGDIITLEDGRKVNKRDFVDAHERRIQRLQRYRMVEQMPNGSWRVDPALVERLKDRDKSGPIEQLKASHVSTMKIQHQVEYRGRTWIDRFTEKPDTPDFSKHGLGQEVRLAVRKRVMFLREMGVDPMDPARGKALDRIERTDLGSRMQTLQGGALKNLLPGDKITGVITASGELPSGRKYAQVYDPKAKEFALVPWQKDFEKLAGKQVELINHAGRYMAKGLTKILGR